MFSVTDFLNENENKIENSTVKRAQQDDVNANARIIPTQILITTKHVSK
jgi:hypothetical protein